MDTTLQDNLLAVRFGPKGPEVQGLLLRATRGRLVLRSPVRFAVHTTLHVQVEAPEGLVRVRGVVERLVPLGPWPRPREASPGDPVALTVLVFSDNPALDALVHRLSARDERRRHPRVDEPVRASQGAPSALGLLRVANVCEGGACLEHPAAPPVGEGLAFRLHLPDDGAPLRVVAHVVHVLPPDRAASLGVLPGVGVAFDDLGPADVQRLQAFVARQSPPTD